MLFVRVIGMTKIVVHRDGLHDALNRLLTKGSDTGRDHGNAAGKMVSQLIIERANAFVPSIQFPIAAMMLQRRKCIAPFKTCRRHI